MTTHRLVRLAAAFGAALLATAAAGPLGAAGAAAKVGGKTDTAGAAVRVTNFAGGETIRFPVALIRGTLADQKATSVTVVNTSSRRDTRELAGLARKGEFKALTELVPGVNRLVIRAGTAAAPLTLTYKPQTNPYVVRVIYFTDRTGDTKFQTPLPNDPQDWRGKLGTAMKLMQTFTAERLGDLGFGRRTFNLEFDDDGKVKVHLLKGSKTAAEYQQLDGGQLYGEAGREIARQMPSRCARNLVIPAFTRFDPNTGKALAHTALGGGNLALFGGGDLFTWPDRLADVQRAFTNATRVDPKRIFSDSVGRHTFWAIASTTMGAALHELGHTFGLPHSRDRHDIMTRGHDRLNRFFTLVEPPHARQSSPREFTDADTACWSPVSGGALAANRYFALDRRAWRDDERTAVRYDRPTGQVVIESPYGIRYVGVWVAGPKTGTHSAFPLPVGDAARPPTKLTFALAELRKKMGDADIRLRVIDGEGLPATARVSELLAGPFVRAWRFASIFTPWRDTGSLPAVDPARLKAIEASAAKARLAVSPAPYVDFLALSGSRRQSYVAGYALRVIRSEKARKIKLHTGSDDALRIWLNGKCIRSVTALRGATADSEVTEADLVKGDNRLLVEVGQGIGGWGLILRITDADGKKLELTDKGELVAVTAP